MKRWIAAILLALAAPAVASPADQAFAAGRFAEAATAGRAEGTVAALVTAGRANATIAVYQTPDKARARALLVEAERDLAQALKTAPTNLDAMLQHGIVVGYIAKLDRSPGLAKQARRQFEAVVAKRPNDALALGAMGGWHGESVATLGRFVAGTALGAREKDSIIWYDKAVAAPGADPVVPIFYASTLLALSDGNAPKARALLERSAKGRPADGFEALVQKNGRAILALLQAGRTEEAVVAARRLSPLGSIG